MDMLEQKDIKQLIDTSGEWCISLYMPAHRVGREQQQDPIRFKNFVARAEKKLLEYGVSRPEVQELMRPLERLVTDEDFWRHQSDGLSVFLSTDFTRVYRLPSEFDELLVTSKKFHIKPLLPLVNGGGHFYILAMSLNRIRLFLCTKYTINEQELANIPTSMEEALSMDDPEKHLGYHTGTRNPATSGSRPAVFHGQGKPADEGEKNILRYFQIVDQGLRTLLADTTIPLVLAGVDYLLPIYHNANSYAGLLKEGLEGNPDEVNAKELHQRAWKIIKPIFDEDKLQAIKQFEQLYGKQSDLATDELKTVVKAAKYGQVETLFISPNIQHWGRFEPESNQVHLDGKPGPENEDLLNFAASQTFLNAGKVHTLQADKMPGNGDLAAILRYPG